MSITPTRKGVWYLWNKSTDEITDAHDTYKTWEELVKITEDPEPKRVASTKVGQYWVSTIFMGLDHNFRNYDREISKGIFFETMIFNNGPVPENEPSQPFQDRYKTAQEARIGHELIVMKLKAALDKNPDKIDWDSFYEQQPTETRRDEDRHI